MICWFFIKIIDELENSWVLPSNSIEAKCLECDSECPQRDARARAENSMFPGGFNAVLTDWQIPRLNSAKSFHQDAHARYISIVYFEYIASSCSASGAIYVGNLSTRRPIENLAYHRSAMTNEIIDNF